MKTKKLILSIAIIYLMSFIVFLSNFMVASADQIEFNDTGSVTDTINVTDDTVDVEYAYLRVLDYYYNDFIDYCNEKNVIVSNDITFEAYCNAYYSQSSFLISEYKLYLESIIDNKSTQTNAISLSDILVTVPSIEPKSKPASEYLLDDGKLPSAPNYSSVLYNIKRGDILFESGGSARHTAFICGSFTDDSYGSYWKTIESVNPGGVSEGYVDDNRLVQLKAVFLSVPSSTSAQREQAYQFCLSQLGKDYGIHTLKPISPNKSVWMCSTLIWAAYKFGAGIDICPDTANAYPSDIYGSRMIQTINLINCEYLDFTVIKSYYVFPFYWNWDIKITNPNSFPVNIQYNKKLCFQGDASNYYGGLNDLSELIEIPAGGSRTVRIDANFNATTATACIFLQLEGQTYNLVTFAYDLAYSDSSGGTCTQKNVTFLS